MEHAEPVEPTERKEMIVFITTTIILLQQLSDFSPTYWSRTIVHNSTDHGNEVMVAQFVFSFPQAIFREK